MLWTSVVTALLRVKLPPSCAMLDEASNLHGGRMGGDALTTHQEGSMRKVAFAFAAAALMLLAGALSAEATTGAGTLALGAAAKNFSPVETVGCRVAGPVCEYGRTWVCRPLRGCWCARCWR